MEHSNIATLMRKSLQRQSIISQTNFRLKHNQVKQIVLLLVKDQVSGPYTELLKILRNCPVDENNFIMLFDDCLSAVVLLGKELKELVEVICNVDWTSRDMHLVDLYKGFILNLMTAHTYHSPVVMKCLVKQFKVEGEHWESEPPEELVAKWSNVHELIVHIIAIMPMVGDILTQTIIDQFPYYKSSSYINRAYVHNIICLCKYVPSQSEQLMTAIVNRMVMMDVNMVGKAKSKQSDTIFAMDLDVQEDEVGDSLDYCMVEMLKWLQESRHTALNMLCKIFDRVVLPTYGIRHVQFLLLYTISKSQRCADRVLNNLWIVAAGQHESGPGALSTRRTAACHLSGLLARCIRLPDTRLIHYLRSMADWCNSYVTAAQESSTVSDNMKVHGAFHAICHAIFYLVAFKHQYLFATKESIHFVESLNLSRLVTCPLNPLRTCPPQVSRAFSSVTRSHQLVYCQSIMEKNSRYTLTSTTTECCDDWFPYDPYTLPRSGEIIWPLCVEYKDWPIDGDEDQYSSRKRKMDPDEDDFLVMSPQAKIASSLSNCISPGFKSV